MNNKITIIDSMCGSGKTTFIFNQMYEKISNENEKFLYIVNDKSEVDRAIEEMNNYGINFFSNIDTNEKINLALESGFNIAVTFQCFKNLTSDLIESIKKFNYNLILDEVNDLIEPLNLTSQEMSFIVENGYMTQTDEMFQSTNNIYCDGIFNEAVREIQLISKEKTIKSVDGKKTKKFMWIYPISIFESFKSITFLTYLFDGSVNNIYLKMNNIDYNKYSIENINGKYNISEYKQFDNSYYKQYMNIIQYKKINLIGEKNHTLSNRWWNKNSNDKEVLQRIANNLRTFLRKTAISFSSKNNMFCVFNGDEYVNASKAVNKSRRYVLEKIKIYDKIDSAYFTKNCHVSVGTKSTNIYSHKTRLAYLVNRFQNPNLIMLFNFLNIEYDEDLFAVRDMVQWIFRSGIRNPNPDKINIYIPSKRMRNLLIKWLNNEI